LDHLVKGMKDKNTPVKEVHEACEQLMRAVESNNKQMEDFYLAIEKPLFANWPNEATSLLIKGRFNIKYAWQARGTDWADKVSDEGWKLLKERLSVAEEALDQAWKLNPKDEQIALQMMALELGQGKGRQRMELWFDRAMKLNTNSYAACNSKCYYLEPKWYGSPQEMLKFGRECLESKIWGGRVPLILVEVHYSLAQYLKGDERKKYWKRPDVWKDIKASYDLFLERHPAAEDYRNYYARYAYWGEQWDEMLKQLKLLKPDEYDLFGGKTEYEKLVKLAIDRVAGKSK